MRWDEDEAFVAALASHRYIERRGGSLEHLLSSKTYELMHDLWLDGIAHATPESVEGDEQLDPTPHVLERARRLQSLAMNEGASPHEKLAAWHAFEKIWKQYKLPIDFGVAEK